MPAASLFFVLALQAADTPSQTLPISIDRVRAALERPAALNLVLPEPAAHFHVEVNERRYFPELPPIDYGGGPHVPGSLRFLQPHMPQIGSAPPLVGVDLLAIGRELAQSVNGARRARAERAAREEVERALREFCAAHECPPR